jgi:CheY-like chemotaxis protein
VRIYSEHGLGTTVTAFLPATSLDASTAASAPAAPRRGNGEVVLVAEDEPALREVTRRILARNGYQVIAVASGAEALTALTHQVDHVDLLLTDVIMPQMQGKELASRVLALHPDTRVVYMSGYTQGLLSAQGVLESGIHLIEKPFSETTLLTKVHEVLKGLLSGTYGNAPDRPASPADHPGVARERERPVPQPDVVGPVEDLEPGGSRLPQRGGHHARGRRVGVARVQAGRDPVPGVLPADGQPVLARDPGDPPGGRPAVHRGRGQRERAVRRLGHVVAARGVGDRGDVGHHAGLVRR